MTWTANIITIFSVRLLQESKNKAILVTEAKQLFRINHSIIRWENRQPTGFLRPMIVFWLRLVNFQDLIFKKSIAG